MRAFKGPRTSSRKSRPTSYNAPYSLEFEVNFSHIKSEWNLDNHLTHKSDDLDIHY